MDWEDLNYAEKLSHVRAVANRRKADIEQHSNVVSVGYGIKHSNNASTDEPCLRVFVDHKWKTTANIEGKVPPEYTSYHIVNGTRHRIQVKTDVVTLPEEAKLEASASTMCSTRLGAQLPIGGTICCLLSDAASEDSYMLGCNHVLGLTKLGPPLNPTTVNYNNVLTSVSSIDVAHLRQSAPPSVVDAAIAKLLHDWAEPAEGAFSIAALEPDLNQLPLFYKIKRGTGVAAPVRFHSLVPHTQCGYAGGRCYRFRRVIFSQYLDSQTIEGDSGAPLVDEMGRLFGMHFARAGNYSLAFPIADILENFPATLRLKRGW